MYSLDRRQGIESSQGIIAPRSPAGGTTFRRTQQTYSVYGIESLGDSKS
jgi:hypothetical protein